MDEVEFATKIENTNTILSRIVLKVIEDSTKSIDSLKYLKSKLK